MCPGRGAALLALLRRAGTHRRPAWSMDPGSAAHRHSASKTRVNALMALRSIRGTHCLPVLILDSTFKKPGRKVFLRSSLRAERSNPCSHEERMDCFASLAMTARCGSAFPRRDAPELCMNSSPRNGGRGATPRGSGECRVPVAPAASCAKAESTRVSHHGRTGITRHSRTQRF